VILLRKAIAALSAIALVSCGGRRVPKEPAGFQVGLVTPGSIADAAWNSGAYKGLEQIRDSLKVSISQVEAHTPSEQEEALRTYAAKGFNLVFGHGFEFQGPAERVSAQYPNTVFIITSGEKVANNVSPLIFRLGEASYLAGIVAGGMTKTNIIAFVGGIELPPIKEAEAAWVDGAKSVNPKITARSTYLNTFDDVAAGREAALALIQAGADMFHHNADQAGLGVFQAVKESKGAFIFGANAEQSALAPERTIGSAVIDLPRAILSVAREVKGGAFKPKVESFGLKSGVIRYEPNPALAASIPQPVQVRLTAARDSIIAADGVASAQ
jgi:basic membrane lipoprotein Med (substrate-binding protein (PBP1-ABC) superfamily)